MAESADVVLAYWGEHRQQARQSEDQRSQLTNYILVIVTAISGFIVQQNLKPATAVLSVLIALIGVYGAVAVAKYHERADYHLLQARALTRALVESGQLANHDDVLDDARQTHQLKYPKLHKLRLNKLWTGLHIAIALYGVALTAVTLIRAAT
jgi:hypothetical protein